MAFRSREFSVLAYANGFTLWHYRTADPVAALLARPGEHGAGNGYFDSAGELLRPGDRIMVSVSSGPRPMMLDLFVTDAKADGGVSVALAGLPPLAGKEDVSPPGETLAA